MIEYAIVIIAAIAGVLSFRWLSKAHENDSKLEKFHREFNEE